MLDGGVFPYCEAPRFAPSLRNARVILVPCAVRGLRSSTLRTFVEEVASGRIIRGIRRDCEAPRFAPSLRIVHHTVEQRVEHDCEAPRFAPSLRKGGGVSV